MSRRLVCCFLVWVISLCLINLCNLPCLRCIFYWHVSCSMAAARCPGIMPRHVRCSGTKLETYWPGKPDNTAVPGQDQGLCQVPSGHHLVLSVGPFFSEDIVHLLLLPVHWLGCFICLYDYLGMFILGITCLLLKCNSWDKSWVFYRQRESEIISSLRKEKFLRTYCETKLWNTCFCDKIPFQKRMAKNILGR